MLFIRLTATHWDSLCALPEDLLPACYLCKMCTKCLGCKYMHAYTGHTRNADLRSVEMHYATTMFIHSAYVHALPLVHSSIQLIYSSKYMYDLSVLLVSMLIARNVIACSILRFWFHCYYSLCICTSMLCVWLFQS